MLARYNSSVLHTGSDNISANSLGKKDDAYRVFGALSAADDAVELEPGFESAKYWAKWNSTYFGLQDDVLSTNGDIIHLQTRYSSYKPQGETKELTGEH